MAVVVRPDDAHPKEDATGLFGRTVVLLRIKQNVVGKHIDLLPFWYCAGVPSEVAISHTVLKKIPPAPMDGCDGELDGIPVLREVVG
jgi:hypothetical protein